MNQAVRKELEVRRSPYSTKFLLAAKHPAAYGAYLHMLDSERRVDDEESEYAHMSYCYTSLLRGLFPDHAADYFERVLSLLASDSPVERATGARMSFVESFEFDPFAPPAEREKRLQAVRETLESLSTAGETELRAFLLRARNYELEGEPGRAWLPELMAAALNCEREIARNALMLIEELTGEYGCAELLSLRRSYRRKALAAYVRDRRISVLPDPPQ